MNPDLLHKLQTGFAAQQRGDSATAEKRYREILAQEPRNGFALNLLGVVLVRSERFAEAIPLLETAVSVAGEDPDTLNNLGLALSGVHRYAEAAAAFRSAIRTESRRPDAHNNLGNVLAAQDKHAEAVESFERALRLEPGFTDCMRNLAGSLLALGRLDEALAVIDRALTTQPASAALHNTRGEILLRDARHEAAKDCFERSLGMQETAAARINLSTSLKQLGATEAAEQSLRRVLQTDPENAEAWHHLGVLLEQTGDSNAAADAFRRSLRSNRRLSSSWYQLAKLKNVTLSAEELAMIDELLQDDSILDVLRAPLLFALGVTAEKRGDYSTSIDYFKKAQAIKAQRNRYNTGPVTAHLEACKRHFPVSSLGEMARTATSPVPVFVTGMPRSGTTLTEQILTSHSLVSGAGEVGFINDIVREAARRTGTPYPACVPKLSETDRLALRARYLQQMQARCGTAAYLVDKNPLNFNFIGFIATVFPEARIVYCKRDPVDNCVSIFRLPFDDNQGYSHDLEALGHFYRSHEQLMGHWFTHYPDKLCQVDYESVVGDLEREARRMLDFIGLEFEPAVLRFFENTRPVLTPSTEQVRQRIYSSSINQGQRYGAALSPLLEALAHNGP